MKRKSRLIAVVLVVAMVVAMFPTPKASVASAATESEFADYTYLTNRNVGVEDNTYTNGVKGASDTVDSLDKVMFQTRVTFGEKGTFLRYMKYDGAQDAVICVAQMNDWTVRIYNYIAHFSEVIEWYQEGNATALGTSFIIDPKVAFKNGSVGDGNFIGTSFELTFTTEVVEYGDDTENDDLKLGVWFNGELYDGKYFYMTNFVREGVTAIPGLCLDRVTEGYPGFQVEEPKAYQMKAHAEITNSITMGYTAEVNPMLLKIGEPTMKFTRGESTSEAVVGTPLEEGSNQYSFQYPGIVIQDLAEDITADIEVANCKKSYTHSVLDYCSEVLNTPWPAEGTVLGMGSEKQLKVLKDLVVDLVEYGAAVQIYRGMNPESEELLTTKLETLVTNYAQYDDSATDAEDLNNVDGVVSSKLSEEPTSLTENTNYQWQSVSLLLGDKVKLRCRFIAEDISNLEARVQIGLADEVTIIPVATSTEDTYLIDYDDIYAHEYGMEIAVRFYEDGVQVGRTLHYSVNTYLDAKKNYSEEGVAVLRPLLLAINNYGNAANAYKDILDASDILYTNFENINLSQATGQETANSTNPLTTDYISIDNFIDATAEKGAEFSYWLYTFTQGYVKVKFYQPDANGKTTFTREDLLAAYPTAKYVRVQLWGTNWVKLNAETDPEKYGLKIRVQYDPSARECTLPVVDVEHLEQFSNQRTGAYTAGFVVKVKDQDYLNNSWILSSNAKYISTNGAQPTIQYDIVDSENNLFYSAAPYVIGGEGEYVKKEWRVPPIKEHYDTIRIRFAIPDGVTLYLEDFHNEPDREILDSTMQQITFSNYEIIDGTYEWYGDVHSGYYSGGSLSGKIFSGNLTFTEERAHFLIGGAPDAWYGLTLASGQTDIPSGCLRLTYGNEMVVVRPEVAGTALIGSSFNLKLSYKEIDEDKDGTNDKLQIGVWFNDRLYNNEYFYLTTYTHPDYGERDYTDYLTGSLYLFPEVESATLKVASATEENKIRFHSHAGVIGYAPENTVESFRMAGEMGYKSIITMAKFTSDGVGVCYHDDDTVRRRLYRADGTAIAEGDADDKPIEQFTYDELMTYDAGLHKNALWEGCKVATLEEYFSICAEYGMDPVFSVHPDLTVEQWTYVKNLLVKYNLLDKFYVKTSATSILQGAFEFFGDEIGGYILLQANGEDNDLYQWAKDLGMVSETEPDVVDIERYGLSVEFFHVAYNLEEQIKQAVAQGFERISIFTNIGLSGQDMAYYNSLGVNEFSVDYHCSLGLNW